MKKRFLSIILALAMILTVIPMGAIPAFAEGKGSIDITDWCDVGKLYGTYFTGDYDDSVFKITGTPSSNVNFNNITFENITCDEDGACVYIDIGTTMKNIVFNNCRFINCSTTEDGGAVYIKNISNQCFVYFDNCTFINCHANGNGGAIYINSTNAHVYGNGNTVISDCSADGNGGGIYMNYGKKLEGFLLADNTATGDGGGICNTANGATISNCRFYRNYAKVDGGGIYLDNGTVENCKFYDNDCGGDGYSLCAYWNETKINNCAFTSAYGENAVYNGTQDKCSFPDKSSYQLTVGNGSQGNPYIIKSTDDWDALHYMALKRQRVVLQDGTTQVLGDEYSLYGKYFRLDANIAVCNTVGEVHDYAPLGGAVLYTSYSEFNGNFDGNGHTVTYVSNTGSDRNGVFGYANSATVKNITVNGYIKGGNRVGGIFGSTYNCTAENCTNNATVYGTISSLGDTASFIGGIVGHSECSNYIGCINNGKVEGTHEHIGGIAGYSNGDTVNGCTNNGNVVCFQKCGGIVGTAHETDSLINGEHRTPKILNCINNADVMANYNYAGGLIGYEESDVTLENCIVNGTVSAKSYANAITGYSAPGSKYEGIYYNKAKATGTFGIGLSENAMRGISADESGNLMPYCVNDYIKENKKSKDGWLRAAFDENGFLRFIPDAAAMYMGADGLHHYIENATQVDPYMETLGENEKSTAYYVNGTVIRDGRIQILGNVTLVLDDDCHYDVRGGIGLEKGNSLTVYSYSLGEHMGSMKAATNPKNKGAAAIGGNAANTVESLASWGALIVSSEKHDCGDFTVYGGNIEAIAYSENDMYGVGIGGNSLSLNRSYIDHTGVYNPVVFNTGEETFNGGDGGNVKVYNGNLSVKAAGAVGIGGGNGTLFYVKDSYLVLTDKSFNGGNGGTFSFYGGTVTVESDLAAFGKGRNGGGGRDDIIDPNMTAFTFTKDGVYGALAGDDLSELKKAYNFDDEAFILNGEKCVQFGKYGYSYTEALNPTCEAAGHKAYLLRTVDNLYYEEGGFNVAIGDTSALQTWISEGGDGYIAPIGHDWVYFNENQHKCIHCEKTESHTMGDDGCTKCNGFYYEYSAETQTLEKKAIPSGTEILSDFGGNYTLSGGWYLVHGDVTAAGRITCTGDVHLILENGCDFTAINGIGLEEGVSLSVYAQSFDAEKMGKLTVSYSSEWCAGIGSNQNITCGNISIHGGVITATGGNSAAGIGSGYKGFCGNISVYGGIITATGSSYAAGIGSGSYGSCGNISVYGGNITATGGRLAAGIGSDSDGSCVNILICGGNITATGGEKAAGIGSGVEGSCVNILICGGNITATGGEEAAGIGSGNNGSCESVAISDHLDITAGADKDSAQPVDTYNGERYVRTELNTARKAPTCTENGHIEFFTNEGKYYSDTACTKEITDLASWLKTPETDGGGMISATGHSGWKSVSANYHQCALCGVKKRHIDNNFDAKCDVCEVNMKVYSFDAAQMRTKWASSVDFDEETNTLTLTATTTKCRIYKEQLNKAQVRIDTEGLDFINETSSCYDILKGTLSFEDFGRRSFVMNTSDGQTINVTVRFPVKEFNYEQARTKWVSSSSYDEGTNTLTLNATTTTARIYAKQLDGAQIKIDTDKYDFITDKSSCYDIKKGNLTFDDFGQRKFEIITADGSVMNVIVQFPVKEFDATQLRTKWISGYDFNEEENTLTINASISTARIYQTQLDGAMIKIDAGNYSFITPKSGCYDIRQLKADTREFDIITSDGKTIHTIINFTKVFPHHDTLDEYTWEELKIVSNAIGNGTISADEMARFETFAQNAETKKIKLNKYDDNDDYLYVRIIGFNHDERTDGQGKAGITFMAVNSINKGYYSGDKGDNTSTFAAGWANSPLRLMMQNGGEIYNQLPEDLTSQLQKVKKCSCKGWTDEINYDSILQESNDHLFLLSDAELGFDNDADEGSKYEYIDYSIFPEDWKFNNATGVLFSNVNAAGYNIIKNHISECESIYEMSNMLFDAGGFVQCDNYNHTLLRSVNKDYFGYCDTVYYSGDVMQDYVRYSACVAPCFCI